MTLQSQEGTQAQTDMIAPGPRQADLRPFDQTILLHAPMVVLNRPRKVGPLHPLQPVHVRFVCGLVFNVTVCGNNLEDANQAIPFQPHQPPLFPNLHDAKGAQALAVGIDAAIGFQAGQPEPLPQAEQFQIVQPCIPTVKDDAGGLNPRV